MPVDKNRDEFWRIANDTYKIQQIKEEWDWLIDNTVAKWSCKKNILEIGCYDGGSSSYLSHFAKNMVTIDNNDPCRFEPKILQGNVGRSYKYLAGDSHSPKILNQMKELMVEPWDFVFIDGDHSYEGVKADFYNILPYLEPGTPVAFHDIIITDFHHQHGCYVGEFWRDLKEEYDGEFDEIITNDTWGGIGIVWV